MCGNAQTRLDGAVKVRRCRQPERSFIGGVEVIVVCHSELEMHMYRVVDGGVGKTCITLRDRNGRFHLARYLSRPPCEGLVLGGDRPHLGFGILFCLDSELMFRVIFEQINGVSASTLPGMQ